MEPDGLLPAILGFQPSLDVFERSGIQVGTMDRDVDQAKVAEDPPRRRVGRHLKQENMPVLERLIKK